MKILLTGFKPFNKASINPTEKLLELLDDSYNGNEIHKLLLNVEYGCDAQKIREKIDEIKPDLVLMMGLAGGRKVVNLEDIAVNVRHATITDNKGELCLNKKIREGAPIAYETNLDINKIVSDLKDYHFSMSYHAGTYICNDIYYSTLDYIYINKLNIKCGFVHFPFIDGQVKDKPTLPLEEMKEILLKLIDSISK